MPVTAAFLLAAGLIVGITDQMPTNGFVRVRSEYVEAVRKAGHTPVVICRAESGESLDRLLTTLDVLMLTGGEDVDPSRYGELPSPNLGGVNVERDKFEHDLLTARQFDGLPLGSWLRQGPMMGLSRPSRACLIQLQAYSFIQNACQRLKTLMRRKTSFAVYLILLAAIWIPVMQRNPMSGRFGIMNKKL